MLRTHFCVDICTFYDKIRENDVEEEHRLPDRVCRCDRDQPDTGWNGRWISVDGRRADPGLFHGIWSKFCDIEAALGERNAHCDYSFSAFIRWRNADLAGVLLGGHVRGFTMRSVLLLLYMALLSTVAFSIWALLLKYNPVGKVAVFGFTIPVFGVALSAVFLGEDIWKIQNLAALILVSAGIIFVNREKESKNDTDQRADL